MATYTQTLLMPLPKKHVQEFRQDSRYGRVYRGNEYRDSENREINSILSFFD